MSDNRVHVLDAVEAPVEQTGKPISHRDKMRKALSVSLIITLAGTVVGGFVGWINGDDITTCATFTAPVFTLAGVSLTFYFHQRRRLVATG